MTRSHPRWPVILWSSIALLPVFVLVATIPQDDLWGELLAMIAFGQLYAIIAAWAWLEGGRKPLCRRNHLLVGGRWRCRNSHGTEYRGFLLATIVLLLGCLALVPSQGWSGALGVYGLFPLAALVLTAAYRPPSDRSAHETP